MLHALYLAQEQQGYISANAARHVAEVIGCTSAEVEDVVSYYVMFHRTPVGKFVLQVCTTLSCALAGAERVVEELEHKLGIKRGETDPTGMFTIMPMECLGACDKAPVLMVNNDHWHECLQPEQAGALVDRMKADGLKALGGCHLDVEHLPESAWQAQDHDAGAAEVESGLRAGAHEVRVHARRQHARALSSAPAGLRRAEEGAWR